MEKTWKGYEQISGNLIYNFVDLQAIRNYGLLVPDKILSNFFVTSTQNNISKVRFYFDDTVILNTERLIEQICFDSRFYISKAEFKNIVNSYESNTTKLYYLVKSKLLNMNNKEKSNTLELNNDKPSWNTTSLDGGTYDEKGNSDHYQKQFMELVREQERKYGTIVAYLFCIGNVDKYAGRAGEKAGVPAEKDLTKKSWYQKAARHFKLKIEAEKNKTVAPDRNAYVSMPEEVKDLICSEQPFSELFNVGYVPLSVAIEK